MDKLVTVVRYGAASALAQALEKTWDTSAFSLRMLGRMLIGQVSWKNISGPVTIADYAGQSAQLGLLSYLNFLALISISLGVLNLLPIPAGWRTFDVLYRRNFQRSPVSDRIMGSARNWADPVAGTDGVCLYNDIIRLISG